MSIDINFTNENNRFNFRVACLITINNKILLEKNIHTDFYNLPGGRVKLNESTKDALVRELKEELNITTTNFSLIHINENFFKWQGNNVHEISFVYKLDDSEAIKLKNKNNIKCLDNNNENFVWISIDELRNYKCLPSSIYDLALNSTCFSHTVIK